MEKMAKYFLIESRSPFDSTEVNNNYLLAQDLAKAGNETTLFLVENGVFALRKMGQKFNLESFDGVKLLADDFSLRERGIDTEELISNVNVTSIDAVVTAMVEGQKTIWL